MRNTTETEITEEVVRSFEGTRDPRLRAVMQAAVRHLHAFVREVEPDEREWLAAVEFLTAVGQKSDAKRAEFILLSDTLGVSSLVDLVNHRKPDRATESTILGPFYVPDAPVRDLGATIALRDDGDPATVSGRVLDLQGTGVAGAMLDVWQTSSNGLYDFQDPEQPEHNLRGRFVADDQGRYRFRTVRPVSYQIPSDGPVGQMLAMTGRHAWRAAHIHVIVTAEGCEPVTTHIFDADNPYLDSDAVFGVKQSLIRPFTPAGEGYEAQADFVLKRAG